MIKFGCAAAMGVMTLTYALPAVAQTTNGAGDAGQTQSAAPQGGSDTGSVPQQLGLAPAPPTVPFQPWQPLQDKGVTFSLNYLSETAANPVGGIRRDVAYAGQLYAGADLDMEKILGIGGGTAHFAIAQRHGKSLTRIAVGNNTNVQEIYYKQNTNLAILTYEQKLFDDRLDIEIGKHPSNTLFAHSKFYCTFQSTTTCGNPIFIFRNSNLSGFPSSTWMAHATYHFGDHLFVHAGVQETNPDRADPGDAGWSLSLKRANGVMIPYEVGYASEGDPERRAAHYILGGWFDRGKYADPLRDDRGDIALLSGRPADVRRGRAGIYVRFDQTLARPDSNSGRGLSVFGIAMQNLSGRATSTRFWEFGLLQTGMLPGRDKDTLAFMINDERYSDLTLDAIRAARTSAGGSSRIPRHEYTMELNYGFQVNPAVRVNPNIQYILHPDQQNAPFRTRNIPNALVLGFRFSIDAPTLLGMALGHHR